MSGVATYRGIESGYPVSTEYVVDQNSSYSNTLKTLPQLGVMMTWAELEFIKAELALKGYSTGRTARQHYENGIAASMIQWGVALPSGYLQQAGVAYNASASASDQLAQVMLQKYYAFVWVDYQSWFEKRRTGLPILSRGSGIPVENQFPRRVPYPSYLQSLNPQRPCRCKGFYGRRQQQLKSMVGSINIYCMKSIAYLFLFIAGTSAAQTGKKPADIKTLIVFFDGLRPDYITAEGMPRLYAFRQQACYGTRHHSVFPTVTRVNSSSYSTGSYPARHGLMGNTVYFPQVDKLKGLNTGEAAELKRIDSATHGHLLTADASLGQVLQHAGEKMMVFSSGSTGQALLQNHTLSGGITINPAMILPDSFREKILSELGAPPAGGKSDAAGHAWVTDALMKYGLVTEGPLVNAIWYSEPDGAAHQYGIGSPQARAALKLVDAQFGRILDSLKSRKMDDKTNILISTDHGFVTYMGKQRLADFLIKQGLKKDTLSDDVVVAEGAVYVKDHDKETVRKIVAALQAQEWAGPVFTKENKPGDLRGWVAGTLSFEAVHWNHADRAADILTASNWDDRTKRGRLCGEPVTRPA